MTLDFKSMLERLAAHQLQTVAAAISDPKIARAAGVTGMLLQQAATSIDEAPGRFRVRAADMTSIISRYVEATGDTGRYRALLNQSVDSDRLSGLYARDCALAAALIEVAEIIENEAADWAISLRSELRKLYLRWIT